MTPDLERFLELATRPLEGYPQMRDEAKGELMARVGHVGVPFEMLDLDASLGDLETAPPQRPWPRRIALLASLAITIGTVLTSTTILAYDAALMIMANDGSLRRGVDWGSSSGNPLLQQFVNRKAPGLPLGREILAGKDDLTEPALWLARHPDDLAMWQEHATRQIERAGKEWPAFDEDTNEKIAGLDADNALWPLMQASAMMESCSDAMRRHGRPGTASGADEAKLQHALLSFSEAAAKPRYNDRSLSLVRSQIEAFPAAGSMSDDLIAQGFAGFVRRPFSSYRYYGYSFAVMAKTHCDRLVAADQRDGLVSFFSEWKNVVRLVLESREPVERYRGPILPQLTAMGEVLSRSFDQLGMAAEKTQVQEQLKKFEVGSYGRVPMPPELQKFAGVRLESYDTGLVDLTVEEVLPSRRTELAFFDRHVAISLALLGLVFSGLVGLEACRRSKVVKGTARGLIPLFRREDHLWIGGLGLALPWLWWWVITRLTPLGLRGESLEDLEVGMLAFILQPLAALVFSMVMLLQTARWRWQLRGGFLALGGFFPRLGWVAGALTGLSIPAAGGIGFLTHLRGDDKALFLLGVSCMGSFGLLWLLWEGIMNLFTPRAGALRPNLAMRVLLPWTFAGILSLIAAYGVSTVMERKWFAKDPLLPSWTSKTHRNAFEERRAEAWLKP